jgi:hypothetical protein
MYVRELQQPAAATMTRDLLELFMQQVTFDAGIDAFDCAAHPRACSPVAAATAPPQKQRWCLPYAPSRLSALPALTYSVLVFCIMIMGSLSMMIAIIALFCRSLPCVVCSRAAAACSRAARALPCPLLSQTSCARGRLGCKARQSATARLVPLHLHL